MRKAEIQKNAPHSLSALPGQAIVVLDETAVVSVPLDNNDQIREVVQKGFESGRDVIEFAAFARPKEVRAGIEVQIGRS